MIVAMRAGYSSAGDVTMLKPVGMRDGYSVTTPTTTDRLSKGGKRANTDAAVVGTEELCLAHGPKCPQEKGEAVLGLSHVGSVRQPCKVLVQPDAPAAG